jgi:hypothetical protein
MEVYRKYKDSFHLITQDTPATAEKRAEIASTPPVLTGVN